MNQELMKGRYHFWFPKGYEQRKQMEKIAGEDTAFHLYMKRDLQHRVVKGVKQDSTKDICKEILCDALITSPAKPPRHSRKPSSNTDKGSDSLLRSGKRSASNPRASTSSLLLLDDLPDTKTGKLIHALEASKYNNSSLDAKIALKTKQYQKQVRKGMHAGKTMLQKVKDRAEIKKAVVVDDIAYKKTLAESKSKLEKVL